MTNLLENNIARVLDTWLTDEIIEADTGRNAYLSEFDARKADFDKPFEDPSNTNAQKVKGHHNRLRMWTSQFAEYDSINDDQPTARLVFCSLMFIAGSYRVQCLLESESFEQYMNKRHESGPLGIDLHAVVRHELASQTTLSSDPASRLDNILRRTEATNEENLEVHTGLYPADNDTSAPVGDHGSLVEAVVQTQRLWAELAVSQIMVAASFRDGDYAQVPFFEPKSITDQTALQYLLS